MTVIVSVIVLGILVFVHEFGHFLVAKWNNIGVLDFSVGFGKAIWKKKIGETRYAIRIIPLGGYVRMVGDDFRQLVSDPEPAEEAEQEELDEEEKALLNDQSRWFLKQGFFAKAAVVFAGPAFNFIFAILVSIFSFYIYGKVVPTESSVIGDVIPGFPAEEAGLKAGDRVKSIDGEKISSWQDLAKVISTSEGRELNLVIDRFIEEKGDNQELTIEIAGTQETQELAVLEGKEPSKKVKIGITPEVRRDPISLTDSVVQGSMHTVYLSLMVVRGMWGMIRGLISPKNIAGPIFIFKEAARSAKKGLEYLMEFMIFLSISLAILNLLPIPILDGGHLVFFVIEALKGSPVNLKVQEVATQIGMLALLLLMVFAIGNDVMRLFQ